MQWEKGAQAEGIQAHHNSSAQSIPRNFLACKSNYAYRYIGLLQPTGKRDQVEEMLSDKKVRAWSGKAVGHGRHANA
jgi:hypothetical protein